MGTGVPVQVAAGLVATVAGLALLRPVALRHLRQTPELRTGTAALVGRDAVVLARVDTNGGQVKLAGEVWSARAMDGLSVFEVGNEVQVLKIDGATALVG
jgi:membrane protein implicated in regulation of membrane protease activity